MSRSIKTLYLALIYLFFYFPIAIVIIYSFNDSKFSLIWQGFTLDWYHQLFQDDDILKVTWHSLIIGVLASTSASLLGTLAAACLFRYRFFGKQLLHGLIFILIVAPDIITAVSLLLLYNVLQIPLGFTTLLLAHITFCAPFVAVIVYGRIGSINKNIFEAAKDLGASEYKLFTRIIIPLMWPGIIAGWLLSFTLSLDDVIISYFVTGPSFQILPLTVYSMVRFGVKPEINALCTILFSLTLIIVLVSQKMLGKKQ